MEVVVRAKLPDDLSFEEYHQIVDDLRLVIAFASFLDSIDEVWDESVTPDSTVIRVQYGSDFLFSLVLVGVTTVLPGMLMVSKIVNGFADARLKKEQRLGLKEERIRRMKAGGQDDETRGRVWKQLDAADRLPEGVTPRQFEQVVAAAWRLGELHIHIALEASRTDDPDDEGPSPAMGA